MSRFVPALLLVLSFSAAACTDSNPMASSDPAEMAVRESGSMNAPGFLTVDGLPALSSDANRKKAKSVVCHFDSRKNGRMERMELPGPAAEAHMAVHPEDGYVGHGFADDANSVRYTEDCEPLPAPPACPCWKDYSTWTMLAALPWDAIRMTNNDVAVARSEKKWARAWPFNLKEGQCGYNAGSGTQKMSTIGPVARQCAADVMSGFSQTHQ